MRGLLNLLLRLNLYCIVNILLSFIQLGEYFFQLQLNKLLHTFVGNLPRDKWLVLCNLHLPFLRLGRRGWQVDAAI